MRLLLKMLFAAIFLYMVAMTAWVAVHKSILASPDDFSWASSPWAVATLFDAYFGFLTFYVWVAYKERAWGLKVIWFALIMGLGNIAMSLYVLLQLFKLRPGQPASAIFQRDSS